MYSKKSNMVFVHSSGFITLQVALKFKLFCLTDIHQW